MKNNKGSSHRAKARWKFLAQALTQCHNADAENGVYSVRRFSGYDLFDIEQLKDDPDGFIWFQYTLKKFPYSKPFKIRVLQNTTSARELIGFNNTGNICIWPSEEVLAYFCMKNKKIFKNKKVCELGCGMTGLAGIQVAGNTECSHVFLSDGNQVSVENINKIIEENRFKEVKSSLLRWGENLSKFESDVDKFDIILCADCLFFVDAHVSLLGTIKQVMKKGGVCFILAPRRSGTLDKFVNLAKEEFVILFEEKYDDFVWNLHETSLSNELYSSDLHYPLLIKLWHKEANGSYEIS